MTRQDKAKDGGALGSSGAHKENQGRTASPTSAASSSSGTKTTATCSESSSNFLECGPNGGQEDATKLAQTTKNADVTALQEQVEAAKNKLTAAEDNHRRELEAATVEHQQKLAAAQEAASRQALAAAESEYET